MVIIAFSSSGYGFPYLSNFLKLLNGLFHRFQVHFSFPGIEFDKDFFRTGLLDSGEVLGYLLGTVRSIISCEVDASIFVSKSGRNIVNNREQVVGLNMGACGFSVIRRAALR